MTNRWNLTFFSPLRSLAILAAALVPTNWARADEPLPSQDQALTQALETHPDIVAAKAKVALAEAELYGKRMEVSRQILGLYGNMKSLDAQTEALKAALQRSRAELDLNQHANKTAPGSVSKLDVEKSAAEVQTAEAQLVQTIGQREQVEKELRLLVGKAASVTEPKSSTKSSAAPRQVPQGPIVDKVKTALQKPVKWEFVETPLKEVITYFSDTTNISFSIQRPALGNFGLSDDVPISLRTGEVPMQAALQAFEDAYPDLQFVMRDYGILLTTKDYAREHGYAPVLELGKETAAAGKLR
jgi:murein DD-endopeptidase MepM/ murein hydrolase activator NlpD